MAKKHNWAQDPIDYDFVLDSGLLFEVNRQYFHPFGISLTVITDEQGKRTWGFKDLRADPTRMVFDKNTAEAGMRKWVRFLEEWGYQQMARRTLKLGQAVQHIDK